MKEKPQPSPIISEKELEERKRAEEKATKEILRLTQVGNCLILKSTNAQGPVVFKTFSSKTLPGCWTLN